MISQQAIDARGGGGFPVGLFKPGHRLRVEIANCDSVAAALGRPHTTLRIKAKNTVHEGGGKNASRLIVPFIPR